MEKTTPTKRQTSRDTPKKGQISSFADVDSPNSTRVLRIQKSSFSNFKDLVTFPNLRILDIRGNSVQFTKNAILVAFRTFSLSKINGENVTSEEICESCKYSGIVTYALRKGMDPNISTDSEESLNDSLAFLHAENSLNEFSYDPENCTVTINEDAEIYSWSYMDENCNWVSMNEQTKSIVSSRISPLKCTTRGIRSETIYIPEYDNCYHCYAELLGEAVEGGILSVKTSFSNFVEWKDAEDGEVIAEDTFVLPIKEENLGKAIICEVSPGKDLPVTKLVSPVIKSGEFRFRSLRMQGQLIEDDSIGFDVSTTGTNAKFVGVRILRSGRYGEWENVTTLESDNLSYKLTVNDIGCVIRAICLTEGGGPPLMITSAERVQPSAPTFNNPMIVGTGVVGVPLFAIADYKGGMQGNCRYKWNIGNENDRNRPVIIPRKEDTEIEPTCRMTPIRSDGSIGKTVVATFKGIADSEEEDGAALEEHFIKPTFAKDGENIKLEYTESPQEQLLSIQEGKTIEAPEEVSWAVVTSEMIHNCGVSKKFVAPSEYIKGLIVILTDTYFSLVGQIEASDPIVDDVKINFDSASSILSVSYKYSGGVEGRSIIQWNKISGKDGKDVPISFNKTYHVNFDDRNSAFKATITPFSIDGKQGKPVTSEPFMIKKNDVALENEVQLELKLENDHDIYENETLVVATEGESIPKGATRITVTRKLAPRERIVWEFGTKLLAEGIALKLTTQDIGHEITCRIIDRVASKNAAVLVLPPVLSLPPTIESAELSISDGKPTRQSQTKKLTVKYDSYIGGVEGATTIIWMARKNKEEDFQEIATTKRKWIEVEFYAFSGWEFYAKVKPVDSEGNVGEIVETNHVNVNEIPKDELIDIVNAYISIDDEFKNLICNVETNGKPGKILYNWGYMVDGEEQYIDDENEQREISEYDFEYPLFCKLTSINAAGINGEKALVFLQAPLKTFFTPVISKAKVVKRDDPKEKIVDGDECAVSFTATGPNPIETSVVWERLVNGNQWVEVSNSQTYTTNGNDLNQKIRATISITIINPFTGERVESEAVVTKGVTVLPNQTIVKIAASLRRAKAQFEAKSVVSGDVTILIENGFLTIKSKTGILLRDRISCVSARIVDDSEQEETKCVTEIMGRQGYCTQVVFDKKKMSGGTKLSSALTRELFIEVLRLFRE